MSYNIIDLLLNLSTSSHSKIRLSLFTESDIGKLTKLFRIDPQKLLVNE